MIGVPNCPKCDRNDSMIKHGDEWVCHHTHRLTTRDEVDSQYIAQNQRRTHVHFPDHHKRHTGICGASHIKVSSSLAKVTCPICKGKFRERIQQVLLKLEERKKNDRARTV